MGAALLPSPSMHGACSCAAVPSVVLLGGGGGGGRGLWVRGGVLWETLEHVGVGTVEIG